MRDLGLGFTMRSSMRFPDSGLDRLATNVFRAPAKLWLEPEKELMRLAGAFLACTHPATMLRAERRLDCAAPFESPRDTLDTFVERRFRAHAGDRLRTISQAAVADLLARVSCRRAL